MISVGTVASTSMALGAAVECSSTVTNMAFSSAESSQNGDILIGDVRGQGDENIMCVFDAGAFIPVDLHAETYSF